MAATSRKRDLRLEMRVKNNALWRAIHEFHPNVADFCRKYGLHQSEVGECISFKMSPFTKKGEYRTVALRLSEIFGMAVTELFPPKLYAKMLEIGSFKAIEVHSFAALPRAARREIRLLPVPVEQSPTIACEAFERDEKIKVAMKTLSYREREILKMRYGLFGEEAHTLEEAAKAFKVNKERIRQIEAGAVRKLQQPHHSHILVELLD